MNAALEAALRPIAEAAIELGASRQKANLLMVDCFAHATGLLLLLHTGRIRMCCESHVCVQQTVLGLLEASRKTYIARDALGSRHPEDKETAIRRMEWHGAEIVTTEMVVFEWLQTADDERFRPAIQIIK